MITSSLISDQALISKSNPVLIINMKKERGQEGEKEPAIPLLETLDDILRNRIKKKQQ
jgi:hypothetical protein